MSHFIDPSANTTAGKADRMRLKEGAAFSNRILHILSAE